MYTYRSATHTHMHRHFVNILPRGFSIIQANCIVMGYSTFMNSGYLKNELITRQMKDFNYSPPNSHIHAYTDTHARTRTHTETYTLLTAAHGAFYIPGHFGCINAPSHTDSTHTHTHTIVVSLIFKFYYLQPISCLKVIYFTQNMPTMGNVHLYTANDKPEYNSLSHTHIDR